MSNGPVETINLHDMACRQPHGNITDTKATKEIVSNRSGGYRLHTGGTFSVAALSRPGSGALIV